MKKVTFVTLILLVCLASLVAAPGKRSYLYMTSDQVNMAVVAEGKEPRDLEMEANKLVKGKPQMFNSGEVRNDGDLRKFEQDWNKACHSGRDWKTVKINEGGLNLEIQYAPSVDKKIVDGVVDSLKRR